MEIQNMNFRRKKVKLIFNPSAGKNRESPVQLLDIIKEMQNWKLVPEPFLIEPGCDLNKVIEQSILQGFHLFIVCGGDGTVSAVANAMVNTTATLGIIPIGTRNNIALSLKIPTNIPEAISILRTGQKEKIDVGIASCNGIVSPFTELCSIGLFPKLFTVGDDIKSGKITKIGDFLSTFINSPPSEISILLENKKKIKKSGHVVIISNMPYISANLQVGATNAYKDGLLDILFYSNCSKLDILGTVLKSPETCIKENPNILHYQVRKATIETLPEMPIMADSANIGKGVVSLSVKKRALTVMVPSDSSDIDNG